MKCPKCNENLPDDYMGGWCDQCGDFIYRCADENCPGFRILTLDPGSFCSQCGESVVPNGPQGEAVEPQTVIEPTPVHPQPVADPQPVVHHAKTEGMPGTGSNLIFVHSENWQIQLAHDDILGRVSGRFADKLGSKKYVSGSHAKITKTQDGWYITDLKSTNKTWVNDRELPPELPVLLKPNDAVTLASEKFKVILS